MPVPVAEALPAVTHVAEIELVPPARAICAAEGRADPRGLVVGTPVLSVAREGTVSKYNPLPTQDV